MKARNVFRAPHHGAGTVVLILGLLLSQASCRAALAQRRPPLLFATQQEVTDYSSFAAVAEFEIEPDLDRLYRTPELTLELPGFAARALSLGPATSRRPGSTTWLGRIGGTGAAGSRNVVLTLKDGLLAGAVFAEDRVYQIVPRSDRRHRLIVIEPSLFPGCAGEVPAKRDLRPASATAASGSKALTFGPIDIMVLYTTEARIAAGGVAQIEATLESAVEAVNGAYLNSGIHPRLYLAHLGEVGRAESGNLQEELTWVSGDPGVAALRDTHHADLVSLVVSGGASCGIAFVQTQPDPSFESSAFQVTRLDCALANLSMAHELGHLQGAEHNPEDSVRWPSNGSFPWSFGHYEDGSFRTVMSIGTPCVGPCPRQPYFSNPDAVFAGLPTGVAGERENFRTLNDTTPIVAGFRSRPPGIFADGFESGDINAWSCVSLECF